MNNIAIVGLGNPNTKYDLTRHNIGAYIIRKIIRDKNIFHFTKSDIDCWEYIHDNRKVFFVESWEYMNSSGLVVLEIVKKFSISPENIIVIQDDMDFNLGTVRLKFGGGSGGHNGIKSIIENIGKDFYRLRFGIGKIDMPHIEYVLSEFTQDERNSAEFKTGVEKVIKAIDIFINNGPGEAFNETNRR